MCTERTAADQKLLAYGTANGDTATPHGALAKLNLDGSFDASFGDSATPGKRFADATLPPASTGGVATHDGRFLVIDGSALAMVKADGTLDQTFGSGGRVTVANDPAFANRPELQTFVPAAVVLTKDRKILVAGTITASFDQRVKEYNQKNPALQPGKMWVDPTLAMVIRLSTKGTVDMTFGINGKGVDSNVASDDRPSFRRASWILLDNNERILFGGDSGPKATEFSSNITETRQLSTRRLSSYTVSERAYGEPANSHFAYRLTADGLKDTTFGQDGAVVVENTRFPNAIDPLASPRPFVDAANRLLLAFSQQISTGRCETGFLRYTEKGQVDATFGSAGTAFMELDSASLNNAQSCQLTLLTLVPAALDRTIVVGTALGSTMNYPFVGRFWN